MKEWGSKEHKIGKEQYQKLQKLADENQRGFFWGIAGIQRNEYWKNHLGEFFTPHYFKRTGKEEASLPEVEVKE